METDQARAASGAGCRFGGTCAPGPSALASSFSLAKRRNARYHPAVPHRSGGVHRRTHCRASGEA